MFISGDKDTTSPYVLPFDGIIDWGKFSFHFSWDTPAREIVTALLHVDDNKLNIMCRNMCATLGMTTFGQCSRVTGFTICLSAVHDVELGVNDV